MYSRVQGMSPADMISATSPVAWARDEKLSRNVVLDSGRGSKRRISLVKIPRVPSEPIKRWVRS